MASSFAFGFGGDDIDIEDEADLANDVPSASNAAGRIGVPAEAIDLQEATMHELDEMVCFFRVT